ncbi:MAG: DUF496 family protein [Psychrilyobacter sp.]|nr:DUF496 family protein [Psychrilyobacter sp.]
MDKALEIIRNMRRKNQIKREVLEVEKRVRDNRKRVELLDNLSTYILASTSTEEIINIIQGMKGDYEDRIDDYIIKTAEFSKERRDLNKNIKDLRLIAQQKSEALK